MTNDASTIHALGSPWVNLMDALNIVDTYILVDLDDGIGFVIACIASGRRTAFELKELWDRTPHIIDTKVCDWLLDRFAGTTATGGLWQSDAAGRFKLTAKNLDLRA